MINDDAVIYAGQDKVPIRQLKRPFAKEGILIRLINTLIGMEAYRKNCA